MTWPTHQLSTAQSIPGIGFGSANIPPANTPVNVEMAIEAGFSHLDVAQIYGNEEEVGQGIRDSGLARDELWVTTKWSGKNRDSDVKMTPSESLDQSLKRMRLSYVDLYLVHQARLFKGKLHQGWRLFEELQKSGKTKAIGLSNFTLEELKELLENGEKPVEIQPAVLQNPLHLYNWHEEKPIVEYCHSKGIVFEGYSPLAPLTHFPGGPLEKAVNYLAERLQVKPEQVHLAWVKAKGAIPLTTSRSKERLQAYIAAGEIQLSEEDCSVLEKAARMSPRPYFPARGAGILLAGSLCIGYTMARLYSKL